MDEEKTELLNLPLYERNKMRFYRGFDIDELTEIINKTPRKKRYQTLMAFFKTARAKGAFIDEKNPASVFAFNMILKTYKFMKEKRRNAANMAAARWNNGTPGAPPDTDEENTLF